MDDIIPWNATQAAEDAWSEIEPADRSKVVEILQRHLEAAYEAGGRETRSVWRAVANKHLASISLRTLQQFGDPSTRRCSASDPHVRDGGSSFPETLGLSGCRSVKSHSRSGWFSSSYLGPVPMACANRVTSASSKSASRS